MTPEQCLAKANEAEALARLVAFERDKQRLRATAADWRQRAEAAQRPSPSLPKRKTRFWRA